MESFPANRFYRDIDAIWKMSSILPPGSFGSNVQVWEPSLSFFQTFLSEYKGANSGDHSAMDTQLLSSRFSHRLGRYYETIWEFILTHHPGVKKIFRGLPVREKKSTLGEFDFLWMESSQSKVHHLEVAIKYYLYFPECDRFIGPNFQDRLDLKIAKLKKQITLSDTVAGREAILENFEQKELQIQKNILIQGVLFYPEGFDPGSISFLNPRHNSARYFYFHNWMERIERQFSQNYCYMIPSRLEWLSEPLDSEWEDSGMSGSDLEKEILKRHALGELGIMVLEKDESGIISKFFVLPDSIPPFPL